MSVFFAGWGSSEMIKWGSSKIPKCPAEEHLTQWRSRNEDSWSRFPDPTERNASMTGPAAPILHSGCHSALQDTEVLPDSWDPHSHWDPTARAMIITTCYSLNPVYFGAELETQNSDCQWGIQSAVEILRESENWDLNLPLMKKRSESPLQIRGGEPKGFFSAA